jgi:tetratricopeptide (TPR) repeat protein
VYNYHIFNRLADIHYKNRDYKKAVVFYSHALNNTTNDSLKKRHLFQKADCYILLNKYQYALAELLSFNDSILKSIEIRHKEFLMGMAYYGLEDFQKSKQYFLNALHENNAEGHVRIEEIFSKRKFLHRPNPKLALILSLILPGMGQYYAGDIKNGVNSFILLSGIVYLGISIAVKYKFIDAVISVFPWYQRYFQGGYTKAEKIALRKRQAKRSERFNEILLIVQQDMYNKEP